MSLNTGYTFLTLSSVCQGQLRSATALQTHNSSYDPVLTATSTSIRVRSEIAHGVPMAWRQIGDAFASGYASQSPSCHGTTVESVPFLARFQTSRTCCGGRAATTRSRHAAQVAK